MKCLRIFEIMCDCDFKFSPYFVFVYYNEQNEHKIQLQSSAN